MNKKGKIAIIGLGYVGLPLAIAFSNKFRVIGYDINNIRVKELLDYNDSTLEISNPRTCSVRRRNSQKTS